MRLMGIVGWSGSGKTALIAKLLPVFKRKGLRVSTVKHAHHGFDIDSPGKDSYIHREAGAQEVLVASSERWVLMSEHHAGEPPSLKDLIARLTPVDIVLIEGFKQARIPKIEVHRSSLRKPLLSKDDPYIIAVASDGFVSSLEVPLLALDQPEEIADFILSRSLGVGFCPAPHPPNLVAAELVPQ